MARTRRSELQIFHKVTQSRNVRDTIRRIVTVDGRFLTSLPDIKSEAVTHFETFLNGTPETVTTASQDMLCDLVV